MKGSHGILAGIDIVLGLSAVGGATFAIPTLPRDQIEDTIFGSYLVPALALLFLVGLPLITAGVLFVRSHYLAAPASLASGLSLVIYEVVEYLAIGFESLLQPLMFVLGAAIAAASFWLWARETSPEPDDDEWLGGHPHLRFHIR